MTDDAFARTDKLAIGTRLGVPGGNPARGAVSGITVLGGTARMRSNLAQTPDPRPKAPEDGQYESNGALFRVRKGKPMPVGARFIPASTEEERLPKLGVSGPTDAERGEVYARCLVAAGFSLFKESEILAGETLEVDDAESGEQLAEMLRAAGYELKAAKKPKPDDQPKPDENAQGSGPSETS